MNSYYILYHYDMSNLLGVWVSQGPTEPPKAFYYNLNDVHGGHAVVIGDKMPDPTWDEHMDAIADRGPRPGAWWVGDIVLGDLPPNIETVAKNAKTEDDRLHGR